MLVNYKHYRAIATSEMLRQAEAERKRTYRQSKAEQGTLISPDPSDPEKDTEAEADAEASALVPDKSRTFTPPTKEEAVRYGSEIELPEDEVEAWIDHGINHHWTIGPNYTKKIVDWRASMRTWKKNWKKFVKPNDHAGKSKPKMAQFDGDFWREGDEQLLKP